MRSSWDTSANGWSFLLIYFEILIGFSDDLINDVFDRMPGLPCGQLPVRARPLAHDALDVRHLAFAPELVYFRRDKLQDLANQTACLHFAATTEIDQFPIESVARRAPAVLLDHAPAIDAKRSILAEQFV